MLLVRFRDGEVCKIVFKGGGLVGRGDEELGMEVLYLIRVWRTRRLFYWEWGLEMYGEEGVC